MAVAPKDKKKKPKKPQQDQAMAAATQKAFNNMVRYLQNFQPSSYNTTQREMNRLFPKGQLGPTYTPQQLRQQAQQGLKSIFDPRINQIRNTFDRQMKLGSQNITGYTGQYAQNLREIPLAINAANQQGLQQQAAVGGALADYMRNTGAELTGDLTSRLAAAELSPGQLAGTVGTAADTGVIGSGQIAAMNAASLGRMSEEGTAWLNWGNALPGIGILQGQQELGKFQGQMNDAFRTQMGDLQSQMADAGLNLYQQLLDRDLERRGLGLDRSQAMASYLGDSRQRGLNAAIGGASLMQNWAQMLLERELGMAGINADTYGDELSFYDAQNPPPPAPGSTDAPPSRGDKMSALFDYGLGVFEGVLDPRATPNIANARKKVMAALRGRASGMGLSEQQLMRIRDQILQSLGFNFNQGGGQSAPRNTPPPGRKDSPRDDDEAMSDPWITVPGWMFDWPNFGW